ncbi:hypothetical protein [Wenyingzhuangia marina]|nr:hypothetical protein [Wenyingzhuangia marina]
MLSLIFIVASTSHFFKLEQMVKRIKAANFGFIAMVFGTAEIAVVLSNIAILVGLIFLLSKIIKFKNQ